MLIEIVIDGLDVRHAPGHMVYGEPFDRRELETLQKLFLDLGRTLGHQPLGMSPVAYRIRVAGIGGNERPRVAVSIHIGGVYPVAPYRILGPEIKRQPFRL